MDKLMGQLKQLADYLSTDFLGGPRPLKLAWVVNFQKAGTLPFVLLLMWFYGRFDSVSWLYAALHGGYGLLWLLKDLAMPDPAWQRRVTWGGALMSFVLVLGPYWLLPFWLISGISAGVSQPAVQLLIILIWALGVGLMLGADAQKFFTLRQRRGLITDGFFKYMRHPNYLGEMMIYGSFAAWVAYPGAWLVVVAIWVLVFIPNIAAKERSLARYPEWAAYCQRSGLLWPRWPGR